ncbi:MAG: ABC transporter ATP-binding protein [Acidobacteriota bacterium]|nr:ABC transporter ATP-binding protein [Acidobacteriota bacterium]
MADIELEGIRKVYGTAISTVALRGVDLTVPAGEYAAIIGRSGSGKSTLLNILGTLDRPTEGRMRFEGRDLFAASDDKLAEFRSGTLGFIFQFHYLLPEFNTLENVLLPYRIRHGRADGAAVRRAKELIEKVGVGPRMYNRANNLSGGEQQRVAIARSLINAPRVILADEPTGNLDTETSESVKGLLRAINREFKTTFIIVTHDRHIAAGCDRVIEIEDGSIKRDLSTSELSRDETWAELAPCNCREREDGRLPAAPPA